MYGEYEGFHRWFCMLSFQESAQHVPSCSLYSYIKLFFGTFLCQQLEDLAVSHFSNSCCCCFDFLCKLLPFSTTHSPTRGEAVMNLGTGPTCISYMGNPPGMNCNLGCWREDSSTRWIESSSTSSTAKVWYFLKCIDICQYDVNVYPFNLSTSLFTANRHAEVPLWHPQCWLRNTMSWIVCPELRGSGKSSDLDLCPPKNVFWIDPMRLGAGCGGVWVNATMSSTWKLPWYADLEDENSS